MITKNIGIYGLKVLALSLFALSANATQTNLVQNGGFETSSGYGQLSGVDYTGVTVDGWTNNSSTTWWQHTPTAGYNYLFNSSNVSTGVSGSEGNLSLFGPIAASSNGGNFLALDGYYKGASVSQTINGLTIGDTYTVSFSWGAAQQQWYSGDTTEQITATFGNSSKSTAVVNLPSQTFGGWKNESFTFTAGATSQLLSFLATGAPTGQPPFAVLDGISVVDNKDIIPGVPEPQEWAMFLLGLSVLSRVARQKAIQI
jgi:hypothetical protein